MAPTRPLYCLLSLLLLSTCSLPIRFANADSASGLLSSLCHPKVERCGDGSLSEQQTAFISSTAEAEAQDVPLTNFKDPDGLEQVGTASDKGELLLSDSSSGAVDSTESTDYSSSCASLVQVRWQTRPSAAALLACAHLLKYDVLSWAQHLLSIVAVNLQEAKGRVVALSSDVSATVKCLPGALQEMPLKAVLLAEHLGIPKAYLPLAGLVLFAQLYALASVLRILFNLTLRVVRTGAALVHFLVVRVLGSALCSLSRLASLAYKSLYALIAIIVGMYIPLLSRTWSLLAFCTSHVWTLFLNFRGWMGASLHWLVTALLGPGTKSIGIQTSQAFGRTRSEDMRSTAGMLGIAVRERFCPTHVQWVAMSIACCPYLRLQHSSAVSQYCQFRSFDKATAFPSSRGNRAHSLFGQQILPFVLQIVQPAPVIIAAPHQWSTRPHLCTRLRQSCP
jgi:hypothetical protein